MPAQMVTTGRIAERVKRIACRDLLVRAVRARVVVDDELVVGRVLRRTLPGRAAGDIVIRVGGFPRLGVI